MLDVNNLVVLGDANNEAAIVKKNKFGHCLEKTTSDYVGKGQPKDWPEDDERVYFNGIYLQNGLEAEYVNNHFHNFLLTG